MLQTDIVATVLSEPLLLIGLTVAILAVVAWQRTLSYPEFRFAHALKCRVFGLLDPLATRHGRPLVADKSDASREFVRHVDLTPREAAFTLRDGGFSPHLVATAKRRDGQWAHTQWVQFHDDTQQTEVYLFAERGGTDVYAHYEASVTDPEGHLTERQDPGDPTGAVASAFDV